MVPAVFNASASDRRSPVWAASSSGGADEVQALGVTPDVPVETGQRRDEFRVPARAEVGQCGAAPQVPQQVDQPVDRHHAADVEQQHRQQAAFPAPQRHRFPAFSENLNRAQQPELHTGRLTSGCQPLGLAAPLPWVSSAAARARAPVTWPATTHGA